MSEQDMREQLRHAEMWLATQHRALAAAVIHCKEIVDAIDKTEREIATLRVAMKGAE